MGVAGHPEVLHRVGSVERPGLHVVELEPVGGATAAARVERPGAAALVARPDGAAHRRRDGLAWTGAAVDWRFWLLGGRHRPGGADRRRLGGDRRPRPLHLAARPGLLLQQQVERRLEHLLGGGVADGVGEAVAGGVDLPEQPGRHRHVQPAELGVERLHVVAADGVPRGADWFGRPNRLVNQRGRSAMRDLHRPRRQRPLLRLRPRHHLAHRRGLPRLQLGRDLPGLARRKAEVARQDRVQVLLGQHLGQLARSWTCRAGHPGVAR